MSLNDFGKFHNIGRKLVTGFFTRMFTAKKKNRKRNTLFPALMVLELCGGRLQNVPCFRSLVYPWGEGGAQISV